MMKYIYMFFLVVLTIYPLSYAVFNWKNKNRFSAVGCVLLAILSITLPILLIILRN